SYIHYTVYEYGLESPIAAFSIVLLVYKISQFERKWRSQPVTPRQIAALAGIAVLVMFSRLDLIFLVLVVGLWIVFRDSPIRFFAPLDMVIIFASMVCSIALRTNIQTYNSEYASSAIRIMMIAMLIKMACLYFLGAYQHPRRKNVWKTIQGTLAGLILGEILTILSYIFFSHVG